MPTSEVSKNLLCFNTKLGSKLDFIHWILFRKPQMTNVMLTVYQQQKVNSTIKLHVFNSLIKGLDLILSFCSRSKGN